MLELPIPSEAVNLANFLVLDILVLSAIMFLSGKLAGHANHAVLNRRQSIKLLNFDVPLIGGGLLMPRGWRRTTFILVRISAVLAVAACNFGLEGRSRVEFREKMAHVRGPGKVRDLVKAANGIHSMTELRMMCAQALGKGEIRFGLVVDGKCYWETTDKVYIKAAKVEYEGVTGLHVGNCTKNTRCNSASTAYSCTNADVVCYGVDRDYGCNQRIQRVNMRTCYGVVYEGDALWLCNQGDIWPGKKGNATCRQIRAKRENVGKWPDFFLLGTNDPFRAIFAAAYAVEGEEVVRVPQGSKSVTVVSLWWIIPSVWVGAVVMALAVWWVWHLFQGSESIAHDERGLTKLLERQIDVKIANDESDGTLTSISF